MTGLPTTGNRYDGVDNYGFDNYDLTEALQSIIRLDKDLPTRKFQVNELTRDARILHYVLGRVLIPKGGNYATVSE